jgi:hypothetical protein
MSLRDAKEDFMHKRKESGLRKKLQGVGFKLFLKSWNAHGNYLIESGLLQKRLEREEIIGYAVIPIIRAESDEPMGYEFYVLPKTADK